MNRLWLLFCWLVIFPVVVFSQSKRPQVLVYGSGADAYAAALQSSMSNLNTLWVVAGDKLVPELTTEVISIGSSENLDAGIWADLLAKTVRGDKRNDSLSAIAKKRLNPQIAENVIDEVVDAARNLTIISGVGLRTVKKSRNDWQVELDNRQRYRVRAIVDASDDAIFYQMAYGDGEAVSTRASLPDDYFRSGLNQPLSRTGVAVGDTGGQGFTLPLATMVPADDRNLFVTRSAPAVRSLLNGSAADIPLLMHVGQAVGAAAAYTAFFRTTSDKLDLRNVQGEILQYGARLVPFADIPIESPHFAAIQRVGATGLLEVAVGASGNVEFSPDSIVSSQEIKEVMNRLFSRSQIWFMDNGEIGNLTMADLFSLIKYVGHRGNELEGQVQKNWKRRFQFEDEYDEQAMVTRRHFAVLLDAYCKPFDVKVGLDGSIQR